MNYLKLKKLTFSNKLQSELKELNKIFGIDNNLHEIENEILLDYVGEFEMVQFKKWLIKLEKLILQLERLLIMKLI